MKNNVIYVMATILKEKVGAVLENGFTDFSPLSELLSIDDKAANQILEQFVGCDEHSIYVENGEFHYYGDGSICMPSTKQLMGFLESHL